MPIYSTGADASGNPILFQAETPPYMRVNIKYLQVYVRTVPHGAFVTQDVGYIAPHTNIGINYTKQYNVGDASAVGPNEAAALVKAGIAQYG